MAATMKHRRSASKRKHKRGSNRYDKLLTKFKKMKKNGGSFLVNKNNTKVPAHTVTENTPEYKGVTVMNPKKK